MGLFSYDWLALLLELLLLLNWLFDLMLLLLLVKE